MINELVYSGGVLLVLLLGGGTAFWRLSSGFRAESLRLRERQEKSEKTNCDLESRLEKAELLTQNYQEEVVSWQGKIHHLEKDLAFANQSFSLKDQENSQLRQQITQLEKESNAWRSQFEQLEKFHEKQKGEHQKHIHDLHKEKERLSLKIQEEVSLYADLRHQVEVMENAKKTQESAVLKLQSLEQEKQTWNAEKNSLEQHWHTRYASLNEQLAKREEHFNHEKERYQALENELNQARQQLENAQSELELSKAADFQARLNALEQEHQKLNQSYTQLDSDRQQLESRNQELENDYQAALAKLEPLEKDRATLQQQGQKQSDELQQERDRILTLNKQLAKFQDISRQLEQEQDKVLALNKQLVKSQEIARQLEQERDKVLALEKQLAQARSVSVAATVSPKEQAIAFTDKPNESQAVKTPVVQESQELSPVAEKVQDAEKAAGKSVTPVSLSSPQKVQAPKTELEIVPPSVEASATVSAPEPEVIVPTATETAIPESSISEPKETITTITPPKDSSHAPTVTNLEGKNWIILGRLGLVNRDRAKELILESGGCLTSSPSGKTHYAIVGKAPGDKLKKAQKLGISQLSESQFLKLMGVEA